MPNGSNCALFWTLGGVVGPHGGNMKNWRCCNYGNFGDKITNFTCLSGTEECDSFPERRYFTLAPNKTNEGVNRITAIGPGKNDKKRSFMPPGIETDCYPASGIELAAKAQRARYCEGLYPISNLRRIFGNISPNRYLFEFLQIDGVDIRQ